MVSLDKVMIIGAGGLIGNELDFGIKLSHNELDVTDKESIRKAFDKYSPEAVLNLASVNLRNSQSNPFLANKINVMGTYYIALESQKRGIPFIMISTGAVFNGNAKEEFHEGDAPEPQNVYGQTKYLSEIVAKLINPKTVVVRTGWLFGFKNGTNFFNKMIDSARQGNEISATYDQFGSFTYVCDFILKLKEVVSLGNAGIYHIVNTNRATALDMANELVLGLGSKSKIKQISIAESEREGILRSRSEVLVSKSIKLRSWKEALRDCLDEVRE